MIEIFTIIGSTLGIIAFVINFANPIRDHNKSKWDELKAIINLNDFEEICYQIGIGQLNKEDYFRLFTLVRYIQKDTEEVQFKFVIKNRTRKNLNKLLELYYVLREKIQTPYWEPTKQEHIYLLINKDYYYSNERENKSFIADKEIEKDMLIASKIINEMRELYRKIYKDLNRLPYEYFLPWK
jgi:hypothetical protein